MKKIGVTLVAVFLVLASQAMGLEVQTHTAEAAGFVVNSHLVLGKNDAVLIDAQFTRSEARKLSKKIKDSGRNLTTIFITHGHPDHYFGLEVLTKDFPKARVLATAGVLDDMRKHGPEEQERWKKIYKDDLTDKIVYPEVFRGDELNVEGERLVLRSLSPGESEHAVVVYVPVLKTLISGDLVFNQVHLWLKENRPDTWLENLRDVRKIGEIDEIRTGHGAKGDAKLLDVNKEYIEKFVQITDTKGITAKDAYDKLIAAYPKYLLPIIAELSVGARVK